MSGGVDSSVVAALLARAGYEVVGVTLQLYDHGVASGRKGSCCAGQDIADARRVADAIGIPHYVLDYERRFEERVISAFTDSYLAGETPIPCVACNSQIKFSELLDTADELGAAALATGHYVAMGPTATGPALYRGADPARDQSYFMFATTPHQLARLWFPLGRMTKSDVRGLARQLALPVADKADSQDICFVPSGRYADVIERLRPGAIESGEIVHVDGRVLGRHDGIVHYTVGQRRGLGIAGAEPLYVVRVDAGARQVVVGPRAALATTSLALGGVNWLGDGPFDQIPAGGLPIHARIRSTHVPQPALLRPGSDAATATVELAIAEHGVAAGQACVFYSDGAPDARVLGGGFIRPTAARREAASNAARPSTRHTTLASTN
jgi:tRNA-specific 2-thiouridylase